MAIEILDARAIEKMRVAGKAATATLAHVGEKIRAGITTADIDAWVRAHTKSLGGSPSQLGYHGFP
ncbi:MAG: type I methionyl aminopeptidase, partial [Polyangiaceae bacterium]